MLDVPCAQEDDNDTTPDNIKSSSNIRRGYECFAYRRKGAVGLKRIHCHVTGMTANREQFGD